MDHLAKLHFDALVAQHIDPTSSRTKTAIAEFNKELDLQLSKLTEGEEVGAQMRADEAAWIYGILHREPVPSGDFLKHFAEAVVRADMDNYIFLQPAIQLLMEKYPKYKCVCRTRSAPSGT